MSIGPSSGDIPDEPTEAEQAMFRRFLSHPYFIDQVAPQFMAWLTSRIEVSNLNIPIGQVIGATQLSQTVLVSNSSAQTAVNGGTPTTLTWDTEVYDLPDNAMHSTSSNASRLTVVVAGRYMPFSEVWFQANGSGGYRDVDLWKNGAQVKLDIRPPLPAAVSSTVISTAWTPFSCDIGDYFELKVLHDATVNLNILTNSQFGMARIG